MTGDVERSDTKSTTLATPIQFLPGMGVSRAKKMGRLGLRTAQDVVFLFPRSYEFPAPSQRIDALQEGESASLVGQVVDAELVSRAPGKSMFAALVQNETGVVRALFFNQPFRADQLTLDRHVILSGTPKLSGMRMEFIHPKVTLLDDAEEIPEPQILPVYPLTEGVKQAEIRRLVTETVKELAAELVEVMPERLRRVSAQRLRLAGVPIEKDLYSISQAMRSLHLPENAHALLEARTRFVFQELLVMQLALAMRRRKLTTDLHSPPMEATAITADR